jgi:hypothetical protein
MDPLDFWILADGGNVDPTYSGSQVDHEVHVEILFDLAVVDVLADLSDAGIFVDLEVQTAACGKTPADAAKLAAERCADCCSCQDLKQATQPPSSPALFVLSPGLAVCTLVPSRKHACFRAPRSCVLIKHTTGY